MLAGNQEMKQRSDSILLAKHGRGRGTMAATHGLGEFGLLEVVDAPALAPAEFVFDAGNTGETKVDNSNGVSFIDKQIARMNVGMDDVPSVQLRVGIQDGYGKAQKTGMIAC